MHQNDLKTLKIYQFEAKKKIKKLIFFQKRFLNAKTNRVLRNSVKKHVKTVAQKLCFKLNFLMSPII